METAGYRHRLIPWKTRIQKITKQTNAVFFQSFSMSFFPSIIRHHKTRSPTRMCAAVYVTPLLIFALARRCSWGKGTWDHRLACCALCFVKDCKNSQAKSPIIPIISFRDSKSRHIILTLGCPRSREKSVDYSSICLMWREWARDFPSSGELIGYIGLDGLGGLQVALCYNAAHK